MQVLPIGATANFTEHVGCSCHAYTLVRDKTSCQACHAGSHAAHGFEGAVPLAKVRRAEDDRAIGDGRGDGIARFNSGGHAEPALPASGDAHPGIVATPVVARKAEWSGSPIPSVAAGAANR